MNGRVYDYNLGRFLSVDPLIQDAANSQSLNPYSYIINNPLAGTDPTGYRGCAVSRIDHVCGGTDADHGGFGSLTSFLGDKGNSGVAKDNGAQQKLPPVQVKQSTQATEVEGPKVTAATKGDSSGTSQERADVKGVPEAKGADYKFKRANADWKKKGKVSVEEVDGKKVIKMRLTVSGYRAVDVAERVMKFWNGASAEYEGIIYLVDATITAVEENGDWHSNRMSRREELKFYEENDTEGYKIGGIVDRIGGSKVTFSSAWKEVGSAAHEFGHGLGLTHAPKGSGSIMSYDPVRSVKGKELSMLAEGYK